MSDANGNDGPKVLHFEKMESPMAGLVAMLRRDESYLAEVLEIRARLEAQYLKELDKQGVDEETALSIVINANVLNPGA